MHFLIFSLPGGESLAWSGGDAASRLIVAILGKHIRRDNPSAILVAGRAYHHGLLADEELHHHNPKGQGFFQDNPSHNPIDNPSTILGAGPGVQIKLETQSSSGLVPWGGGGMVRWRCS